jgi:hypothetical protein
MALEKSKMPNKLQTKQRKANGQRYAALAEKAYLHARNVAAKAYGRPDAYDWPWSRLPECQQKGYVAMVRFIAKELNRQPKS